jgi:hypothetical protein
MFLGTCHLLVVEKDWDKEGILIAESTRAFLDKESASQPTHWPGALIGEASPVSHVFSMRRPFPKNPYPLVYPLPFNKLGEDPYFFYTKAEARLPGIEMYLLLKWRWSCWWPDYGENYPVLRHFKEKPLNPHRQLLRIGGRAAFSYDPWIHEDFRLAVDDILLSLGFFFEISAAESFAFNEGPCSGAVAYNVQQYPYRDLVRIGGRAAFSYDPWIHEDFRLAVDDASFSVRFWEFANEAFRENPPSIINFSPLLRVPSLIYPKLFTLDQILKLKKEYESQFEFYDPNIIVTRGGRPALERKIINRFVPAIKALGWHNYPSAFHLRTYGPIWTKEPFNWEDYPSNYQA